MALLKLFPRLLCTHPNHLRYPSLKSDGSIEASANFDITAPLIKYPSLKSDGSIEASETLIKQFGDKPTVSIAEKRWLY